MTPATAILKMRLAALKNRATHIERDSLAKVFVVIFGLANVLGLGFWVSHESFQFIEGIAAFGTALNAKMISLFFFALMILVTLSTIIVTYTTVFLARETEFLFQYPIAPRTVFGLKVAEAIAFSSWASVFLCLPVLVAFGFIKDAPLTYYPQVAVVLVSFLLFAAFVGASVSLTLAPIVRRLSIRQILVLGGILLVVLAWVFLRSFRVWDMDGENNLLLLDRFTTQLAAIHSPYFPGNWASSAVLAAAAGNHREVVFHGCTLLANTLVFLPLLGWYGSSLYGRAWVLSHNRTPGRRKATSRPEAAGAGDPAARTDPGAEAAAVATGTGGETTRGGGARGEERRGGPLRALAVKDLIVFVRDPTQVSQSILFVLLMVIYSLSLVRIPEYLTTGGLQLIVYFANLGAICAILSSFTSRFLFPLISLEGKAFWIVGLAPVPRSYILHAKAFFGLVVTLVLGVVTAAVSNHALGTPPELFAVAMYTVVLAGVCLTSLATGLGAAYPVFDEDNPARIAVGLGGTLNFFASALSVAVLIGIQSSPYLIVGLEPGSWTTVANACALAFTGGLSWLCFHIGSRNMLRREF